MYQRWTAKEARASFDIYEGDTFICEIGGDRSFDEAETIANLIVSRHNKEFPFMIGECVAANRDITAEMLTIQHSRLLGSTVVIPKGMEGVVVSVDGEDSRYALSYEIQFRNPGPHDDFWWVNPEWLDLAEQLK